MNLNEELNGFTGTTAYYASIVPNVVLTDGAVAAAEQGRCFWFFDVVATEQRLYGADPYEPQSWKLTAADERGKITVTDLNGNLLLERDIPYTDFPYSELTVWVEAGEGYKVILLPSEH